VCFPELTAKKGAAKVRGFPTELHYHFTHPLAAYNSVYLPLKIIQSPYLYRITVIQRIQTVYLIIAILLTAATYFTSLFDRLLMDPAAWILSGFIASTLFSVGLSAWAIVKFLDRPAQISTLSKALIFQIIAIGVSLAVFFSMGDINVDTLDVIIGATLLTSAFVFQLLARAAIIKDEKLVKSMDRIR
jgi:hypothetical protein